MASRAPPPSWSPLRQKQSRVEGLLRGLRLERASVLSIFSAARSPQGETEGARMLGLSRLRDPMPKRRERGEERGRWENTTTTTIETEVLDVDTWLPYPCPLGIYLDGSFPHANNPGVDPTLLPLFRLVPAASYLKHFYSDRMHMFKGGKWLATPPHYELIMNGLEFSKINGKDGIEGKTGRVSNLEMYISMSAADAEHEEDEVKGKVNSLDQFRTVFAAKTKPRYVNDLFDN